VKSSEVGSIAFKGASDTENFIHILFGEFPDGKSPFGEFRDQVITF
jgi:hypothetical protein